MSQRIYLLNTNVFSSDATVLESAIRNDGKTVIESAEAIGAIPLPWIACFKQSDLQPCTVPMESGETVVIQAPCTTRTAAIENLRDALPLFEHLTGEKALALDYWQSALAGLEKLTLDFLTIDLREMLMTSGPEELDEDLFTSLARSADAVDYWKDTLVAYFSGKLPYPRAAFYANSGITDDERIQNTIAVDMAIEENGLVRVAD